ncbi:MAG: hypothetical protein R3324_19240, partial [Halobacteriales archaeon]|nr:hypothetical protein [Halobacteriales archaeon]
MSFGFALPVSDGHDRWLASGGRSTVSDSAPDSNPDDDGPRDRSVSRSSSGSVEPKTIRRAIREIRREGHKAAFITAAVEAAFVFALANLALSTVQIPALSGEVFLPTAVIAALQSLVGTIAPTTLPRSTLVAVALGTAVAAITFTLRLRRPAIERFERANPPVAEALRTARDTVEDDIDTPVARVLFADVVTRLRTTSSIGLLPLRR